VRAWVRRTFASIRESYNYRLYFFGQLVSLVGTWMQDAALPWLVLQKTHSGFDVGLLMFCRYVPTLVFGLYSGVLADRFDNRHMLIATQTIEMGVAGALALMTLSGWTPLGAVFSAAATGGVALAFEGPNRHALVFRLVGREALPNAVSLNSSMFNAGRAVGPACGGVLIALAGVGWCFAFNALSFAAILIALVAMRVDELRPVKKSERTGAIGSIKQGLGFVRGSAIASAVIGLLLVSTLVGFNFRVLVPVLLERRLHVGAGVFGFLYACFGVGALVGALVSASINRASPRLFIAGAVTMNLGVLLITPLQSKPLIAVLLLISGCGFSTWLAAGQSILQMVSPDHLRGRVLSVYLFVFSGLQPIGSLLAGWLTQTGGTVLAYGVAGSSGLIATVTAAVWLRNSRVIATNAAEATVPVV